MTGAADCETQHAGRLGFIWFTGVRRDVDGVVQRDHAQVVRIIGNENRGEVGSADPRPVKRAVPGVAAGDFFGREVFGIGVELIFKLAGGVCCKCCLVAEAGGPCGIGVERRAVLENGNVEAEHVALIEMKCLADGQAGIGIVESQDRRSRERRSRYAGHVQG